MINYNKSVQTISNKVSMKYKQIKNKMKIKFVIDYLQSKNKIKQSQLFK